MTLATHSIIATAVTKPLMRVHPVLILLVAIASHYLSDALPHWDYKIVSLENPEDKENRRFGKNRNAIMKDIRNFAIDGCLGAAVVLVAVRPATSQQWIWAICAIIGGCLPDFLQGVYIFKIKALRLHQNLHDIFHTKIRLGAYPMLGIPFQALIVLVALTVLI